MAEIPTDKPQVITKTRARGGVTIHAMRYVLAISLALAIGAMVWAYLASPEQPSQPTAAAATAEP